MKIILFRQILSITTTSKMNNKAIINRTITPKIASDCRTPFDLFFVDTALPPSKFEADCRSAAWPVVIDTSHSQVTMPSTRFTHRDAIGVILFDAEAYFAFGPNEVASGELEDLEDVRISDTGLVVTRQVTRSVRHRISRWIRVCAG